MIQTLCLLLAPALLAASIYMLLGRVILVLQAESHAILKKKWLTKIFVTGDVMSFLLQGAGMCSRDNMKDEIGLSDCISRWWHPEWWIPRWHEDWRAHYRRGSFRPNHILWLLHYCRWSI